jgi:dolichol kinase
MNSQLIWLLIFLGLLLLLIIISEFLHRSLKVSTELSRKFLHVSGGLMCLLFPRFFQSHWWLLPLVLSAFILLFYTYKKKMLASVHQVRRYSVGSVLFPVPVYFCFLLAEWQQTDLYYYVPISLLAISDTAAEIAGQRWGYLTKKFFGGQKTLAGTLSFFVTAMAVCTGWLYFGYHFPLADTIKIGFVISITTSIAEGVTLHGWDNLSVPAVAAGILYIMT